MKPDSQGGTSHGYPLKLGQRGMPHDVKNEEIHFDICAICPVTVCSIFQIYFCLNINTCNHGISITNHGVIWFTIHTKFFVVFTVAPCIPHTVGKLWLVQGASNNKSSTGRAGLFLLHPHHRSGNWNFRMGFTEALSFCPWEGVVRNASWRTPFGNM